METPQLKVIGLCSDSKKKVFALTKLPRPQVNWLADNIADQQADYDKRTHMVELHDGGCSYRGSLEPNLMFDWQSDNGSIYATGKKGQLAIYEGDDWRIEKIAEEEEALGWIWGSSAKKPVDDFLALAADGPRFFVRRNGVWLEPDLPEEVSMVDYVTGRSSDEVYLVTDIGILLYDGNSLTELESPEDELSGLVALDNGDLYVTGDEGLHLWSEAEQSWSVFEPPSPLTIGIMSYQDRIWLAHREGVLIFDGRDFSSDLSGFFAVALQVVLGDVYAIGPYGEGGLYRKHKDVWGQIDLPISIIPTNK